MILSLESQGKRSSPIEFLELMYRLKFHMSITEFEKQPYNRVLFDMRMLNILEEYKKNHG